MLWIHYIPDLNPGWEAFCKDSWSLIICLIFVNSGCIVSLIFFAKYLPILKLPNLTNGRGKIKYSCVYLLTNLVLAPKWPIISGQLGNHTRRVLVLCYWEKFCVIQIWVKVYLTFMDSFTCTTLIWNLAFIIRYLCNARTWCSSKIFY